MLSVSLVVTNTTQYVTFSPGQNGKFNDGFGNINMPTGSDTCFTFQFIGVDDDGVDQGPLEVRCVRVIENP